MHVIILGVLLLFAGAVFIISLCACIAGECPKLVPSVSAPFFLFFLAWMIGAATRPVRFEEGKSLPVMTIAGPNGPVQVIVFQDETFRAVNVNAYFGCSLPEGTKVRWRKMIVFPYCGVSYNMPESRREIFEIED